MTQRKPLSRRAWTWSFVAVLAAALVVGVLLGIFVPEVTWLHYVVVAALVVVVITGFRLLGGFEQLEAARRAKRDDER